MSRSELQQAVERRVIKCKVTVGPSNDGKRKNLRRYAFKAVDIDHKLACKSMAFSYTEKRPLFVAVQH